MGKTQQLHSLVLHAHDVGEADRFCILLTKERGRLPARAHGVRKPKSKFGGSILPMQELMMTVRDGSSGIHISDCSLAQEYSGPLTLTHYIHATQCADTLLSILEDDHAVPEVFDLTQRFFKGCHDEHVASVLPYTVQLLCNLGLLPSEVSHSVFDHLEEEEKEFLGQSMTDEWLVACPPDLGAQRLNMLCNKIIEEHSRKPLKAVGVAMSI